MRLSIFLIIAFLVFLENSRKSEGFRVIQDPDHTGTEDLLAELNYHRYKVAKELNAVSMYPLILDISLAALAKKAMESCDSEMIDDGGLRKIRFTMLESDSEQKKKDRLSFDFLYMREAFIDHVKAKGASFEVMDLAHQPLYEIMYSNQTRIGCVFKMCTDGPNYDIFNHVCYLGPEKTLEGSFIDIVPGKEYTCGRQLCPEPHNIQPEKQFQSEILDAMNAQRRAFAQQAPAANMYKLKWEPRLVKVAKTYASRCKGPVEETTRYTAIGFVPAIHPASFGAQLAKLLLENGDLEEGEEEMMWNAQFWWDHTKVACARTRANSSCGYHAYCAFGKQKTYFGSMYAEGKPCTLCSRGCADGLCLGSPKRGRVRWISSSPVGFSFWNSVLLSVIFFGVV